MDNNREESSNQEKWYQEESHSSQAYIILPSIIAMSAIGIIAILFILHLRPTEDNTALIVMVLGFLAPTMLALMALLQGKETHKLFNSRMTELLKQKSITARAEGVLAGRAEQQEVSASQRIIAAEASRKVLDEAAIRSHFVEPAAPPSATSMIPTPQVGQAAEAAAQSAGQTKTATENVVLVAAEEIKNNRKKEE